MNFFYRKKQFFLGRNWTAKNESLKCCYNKYQRMSCRFTNKNITFNNDVNKDVNIRSSKDKASKHQSLSKLINDDTVEKSA